MDLHLQSLSFITAAVLILLSKVLSDTSPMCSVVQGLPGLNGCDGRDGVNGLKGDPGPPGEPGTPGIRGSAGPPGKVGPKGNPGETGTTGQTGDKGATGNIGAPGKPGQKGDKGHSAVESEVDTVKEQLKVFERELQTLQTSLNKYNKILLFRGGEQSGDKVFETNGLQKSFENSQKTCREAGGNLATPRNEAENKAVLEILHTKGESSKAFLGISDLQVEGIFKYLSGDKITFTNFNPGEPNNNKDNEDCVEIQNNGKWNDIPCSLDRLVICEFQ